MKTKFYLAASVVLMLAFVLILGTAAAQPANPCDPAFVARTGKIIRVSPTGVDDTANIQCAFDWANARGPGMTVRLTSGTFHTAQIYIYDFVGSFRGSGVDKTVIVNLPNLYVRFDEPFYGLPSADNPQPFLVNFVRGDFQVSHLAFRIKGQSPTQGWSYWGAPPFYELVAAIVILGDEAHARISHVWVEGEPSDTSIFDYNLFNGIFPEGYLPEGYASETPAPIAGTFEITHSTFKRVGSGTPFIGLKNATLILSHNKYEEVQEAVDGGDFFDSRILIFNNRINASVVGLWLYSFFSPEVQNSELIIRGNTIKGPVGIALEQPMDEASTCLIKVNNLLGVTDTPIFVGPGAEACVLKNNRE